MNRIFLGIFSFFLMTMVGYCQDSKLPDTQELPNLECEVLYVRGSFHGYSIISPKDKLFLDLNKLNELKDMISFIPVNSQAGPSYIPLHQPLTFAKVNKNETVKLIQIKLVSKYEPANLELVFDISNSGSSYGMVILEYVDDFTTSLASLNCKDLGIKLAEGDECAAQEDCSSIDCSKYDSPVKEGHKPSCENNRCKCMCYGCE